MKYTLDYFKKQGSKGGIKSWSKLTKKERSERASHAARFPRKKKNEKIQ